MILALSSMSPTVQAIFFGAAVVLFVLAAIGVALGRIEPVAAGLACFAFVFFYQALAAT